MSMLAGPRIKQKFSSDPRGNAWSNGNCGFKDKTTPNHNVPRQNAQVKRPHLVSVKSKASRHRRLIRSVTKYNSKFGQKLLEKFGWKKGKGLGANEDGNVDHVTVALKSDNRGVGCSKSHADNWIAHQDDFNSLLANLNQTNSVDDSQETQKPIGLEAKSKSSKSRVHYQKFTKGKDLSRKSSEDLDCIFGKRKSQLENSTQKPSDESSADDVSHGVITVRSTDSVQDYFAKKMSKIKTASSNLTSSHVVGTNSCDSDTAGEDSQIEQRVEFSVGDSDNDEEIKEIKKCKDTKKRKIGKSEDCSDGSVKKKVRFSADTIGGESDTDMKHKKIKKRKKKKNSSKKETNSDEDESVEECQVKKKLKKTMEDVQVIVEMTEGSELTGKTKERNRKHKIRETENIESDDKEDLNEEVKDVDVKSSVHKSKKKSSQKTGTEVTMKKGAEQQKTGMEEQQKNKSSGKKKKKKRKKNSEKITSGIKEKKIKKNNSKKITSEIVEIECFFDNDMKDKLIKEKKSQKIQEISQNEKASKLPPEIKNTCNAFPGCNLSQLTGYAYSGEIMKKALLKQKGKLNKNRNNKNQNYNRRNFNRW